MLSSSSDVTWSDVTQGGVDQDERQGGRTDKGATERRTHHRDIYLMSKIKRLKEEEEEKKT